MKKYISFFRMRLLTCVQYRASYVSGFATHLPWGLMSCFAYMALHESNSGVFPMELSAVVTYVWLKEAFYMLFTTWNADNDIFDSIVDGGISYELCRPVSLYSMWFARSAGSRIATILSSGVPIILISLLLPRPFALAHPVNALHFLMFITTMVLGVGVAIAFCMIVYLISFFTISPRGVRRLLVGAVDLFAGNLIPLPFIPQPWRAVFEILPFASMQNVPFRVYSGDLAGGAAFAAACLQVFWLAVLVMIGQGICTLAQRHVVVQGG